MNTVESHFVDKAHVVRAIYETIVSTASKIGPIAEDPKKTSIHLNRRYAFAGIQTRREYLILTLKSRTEIASERVFRREQASANRWYNYMKIAGPDEVDRELSEWLRESYEISG